MTDQETQKLVMSKFFALIEKYLEQIAKQSDPISYQNAWGGVLFILEQAAEGKLYGKIQVELKGPKVMPPRIVDQTLQIPLLFGDIYEDTGPQKSG